MIEAFPNVSYIIIGSKERLSRVKSYQIEEGVECLLCPFQSTGELPSLLDLNVNTFGYKYGKFLEIHGFDPDDRPQVKYINDDNLAYVITRYREIHDFAHVILELPPNVCGEIALKWFEMGQTNLPMTTLSALFGPLRVTDAKEKHFIRQLVINFQSFLNLQKVINEEEIIIFQHTHLD